MKQINWKKFGIDILVVLSVYLLASLLGFTMLTYGVNSRNLLMIYLLGIVIIIIETGNFIITLLSSLLFIFSHNFLFLEPRYEWDVSQKGFVMTTLMFLLVALVVNVLVVKMQRQTRAAQRSARLHRKLYKAIEGLVKVQGQDKIVEFADENISELAEAEAHFCLDISRDDPNEAKKWCLRNSATCGHGEPDFDDADNKYIPIRSNRKTIGVLMINCAEKDLDEDTKEAVMALVSQICLALDRNKLEEQNKKDSAVYAREKIKGTVMKNLSHDMYPRINRIKELAGELKGQEVLDHKVIDDQLATIEKEAQYLSETVDNIFDITSK